MGVRHVEAFDDSLLVLQQVFGVYQCFDRSLHAYLMLDRLDEASDERIKALWEIERDKLRVARAYNNRVRENHFKLGTLL
jgi:hypothetical protein